MLMIVAGVGISRKELGAPVLGNTDQTLIKTMRHSYSLVFVK